MSHQNLLKRRQVRILKSIERVLNQNRNHELIYSKQPIVVLIEDLWEQSIDLDFKYFEDQTDEIREPMGTLFPLWKFSSSVPNRSVTALAWNPAYPDMLVIGYGLCERMLEAQMF